MRCLYHGWKLDVEGNVVEMPSEPAESGFCAKVKHRAYPCQEAGGFVWVWMGDCDKAATFERPAFAPTDSTQVSVVKFVVPCNWAQILEGAIDSAHSSTLHSSDMRPARVGGAKATDKNWLRPSTDKAPKLHVQRTPFGFRYAAIRRPIFNAATYQYVRTTLFVAPITVLIPPNDVYNVANVNVPIDDTHTMFHFIAWSESGEGHDTETWRKFCGAQPGIDLDANWEPRRTLANHHLQDRQAMKLGDFTGIRGIPMQDMAMWASMGPITDRTRDRLGASDELDGRSISTQSVLSGVMLNKDIVHPQMRRRMHKPRIVLLDCPLEYKKGESQTNIEISKEADFARINQIEEEQVRSARRQRIQHEGPVRDDMRRKALAQRVGEEGGDGRVVLSDEDRCHGTMSARMRRKSRSDAQTAHLHTESPVRTRRAIALA